MNKELNIEQAKKEIAKNQSLLMEIENIIALYFNQTDHHTQEFIGNIDSTISNIKSLVLELI